MNPQLTIFYNTIHLAGSELREATGQADIQNDRVLKIFDRPMTPFEVHEIYERDYHSAPITSIRRSMNTLTKLGFLEKMSLMKMERLGKVNHYWRKL